MDELQGVQRLLAGGRFDDPVTVRLQNVPHQLHVDRVVFHHEDEVTLPFVCARQLADTPRRGTFPRGVDVGRAGQDARDYEAEVAPRTESAFESHAAAVHLDELADQRQAQTGALVPPRVGSVHLGEGVENALLIFLLDSDPRVDDGDRQRLAVAPRPHGDAATRMRELDRVAQEVVHRLLDLAAVCQDLETGLRDVGNELDVLAPRLHAQERHRLLDHRSDLELLQAESHLAGLNLRQVQDLVDQLQ